MNTRARKQWIAGAALGAMVVGSVALAGVAAADEENITIGVDIEAPEPTGALTLTVAQDAVQLTEDEVSGPGFEGLRQFTGTLGGVTVSDDRSPELVPDGAYWAVVVQALEDFTADGADPLSSDLLGWKPVLVSDDDADGNVAPGSPILGELQPLPAGEDPDEWVDDPTLPGVQVGDLLVSTYGSADANGGVYEAAADLFLTVPATTTPGSYTSTLTISLFEDVG